MFHVKHQKGTMARAKGPRGKGRASDAPSSSFLPPNSLGFFSVVLASRDNPGNGAVRKNQKSFISLRLVSRRTTGSGRNGGRPNLTGSTRARAFSWRYVSRETFGTGFAFSQCEAGKDEEGAEARMGEGRYLE